MIDQKKLSEFWENNVPKEYKHYIGTDFNRKIETYLKELNEHIISKIDFSEISIALDWGCGGGLGAEILSNHCDVIAVDISTTSIDECSSYLKKKGKFLLNAYLCKDIATLKIIDKVDILFSVSVIQHFPSYEYWKKIVEKWRQFSPKWIAIQTRHGEKNKSNEKIYYDETKNYILGLYLTTNEVIGCFDDIYNLEYRKLINDNYSMYEYFVFKKK